MAGMEEPSRRCDPRDKTERDRTQRFLPLQLCQQDVVDVFNQLQVPLGVPLRPLNRAAGDGMRRRRRRRAAAESEEEEEEEVRGQCLPSIAGPRGVSCHDRDPCGVNCCCSLPLAGG